MELRHFLREYMGWYSVSYVTINIFLNALASRHSVGEVCTVQSEETDCVGRIAQDGLRRTDWCRTDG